MANAIIDYDTGKELSYCKLIKIPKYKKYGNNYSPINLADYSRG